MFKNKSKESMRDFKAQAIALENARKGRIYIGLCGRAQHGKSTLAKALVLHFIEKNKPVLQTAFADRVKAMLVVLGLDVEELWGKRKGEVSAVLGGKTPRFAMQTLATEWGRKMLYDEVWVDAWMRDVNRFSRVEVVIVEDVRHEVEIKQLVTLGAILVEVYRPALLSKNFFSRLKQLFSHSSERLNFRKFGISRINVEEGRPEETLKKFLAMHPELQ